MAAPRPQLALYGGFGRIWYGPLRGAAYDALLENIEADQEFGEGDPREAVEAAIRGAPGEATDLLTEGFRQVHAALAPEAIPYVARLMARYTVRRRSRDAFFRRVGGLLAEATAEDLEQMERLFSWIRPAFQVRDPPELRGRGGGRVGTTAHRRGVLRRCSRGHGR